MRFTLILLALFLGACAQQPFVVAPPIAKLNIQPVSDGNRAISEGNKKIGQSAQSLQEKLVAVRDRLDAAIVTAHQQKEQNAELDKNLADASRALNDAITENTNLRMTTFNQQAMIDKQDQVIQQLSENNEARQKIIDLQTKNLNETRQENANLNKIKEQVNAYWGLGAFVYGAKRLGWRILLLLFVLGAVVLVLNIFVPAFGPIFSAIVKFLISIPGRVGRFIVGLFRSKPPS